MTQPNSSSGDSLWRELADGTAGPVIRLFVSLGLAALLSGLSMGGAYLLAALNPDWNRYTRFIPRGGPFATPTGVSPDDELVGFLFLISGAVYLIAMAWLWSRNMKQRAFWYAGFVTVAMWALCIGLCVFIEEAVRGGEEMLIGCVVFMTIAGMFFVWVQAWRRYGRGRSKLHHEDGKLDVRCPECDYRMVGLHESRCPECGATFTLDELLSRQMFRGETSDGKSTPAPLAPQRGATDTSTQRAC